MFTEQHDEALDLIIDMRKKSRMTQDMVST